MEGDPMINKNIVRPAMDIVEGFRALLRYDSITCAISDSMGRLNAMKSDMKPLFEGIRFVGTAVTVKTLASDQAAAFKTIDLCKTGDVVVIDSHGSADTAFWGENMTLSAIRPSWLSLSSSPRPAQPVSNISAGRSSILNHRAVSCAFMAEVER
jgi:hypothetical protein